MLLICEGRIFEGVKGVRASKRRFDRRRMTIENRSWFRELGADRGGHLTRVFETQSDFREE